MIVIWPSTIKTAIHIHIFIWACCEEKLIRFTGNNVPAQFETWNSLNCSLACPHQPPLVVLALNTPNSFKRRQIFSKLSKEVSQIKHYVSITWCGVVCSWPNDARAELPSLIVSHSSGHERNPGGTRYLINQPMIYLVLIMTPLSILWTARRKRKEGPSKGSSFNAHFNFINEMDQHVKRFPKSEVHRGYTTYLQHWAVLFQTRETLK